MNDPRLAGVAEQMWREAVEHGGLMAPEELAAVLATMVERGLLSLGPREPTEADALWEALNVAEGQRVVEAVLIGKIVNFDTNHDRPTSMSIAVTDGMDWVQQYGMLHGALALQNGMPWQNLDEEDS